MTEKKIQSMPYRAGSEKESEWPPPPEMRGMRGSWYVDPETKELKQGSPPRRKSETAFVLSDDIPPTESMATDKREIFTSRSKLMAHYKEHGFTCTGGDHLGQKAPQIDEAKQRRDLEEDAARAFYDIKYDRVPFTEYEKEICKREENAFLAHKRRQ